MIIFPPQKNNASALHSKTCKHKNCVKLYLLQVPDKAEQQQAALLDGMVLYAKWQHAAIVSLGCCKHQQNTLDYLVNKT